MSVTTPDKETDAHRRVSTADDLLAAIADPAVRLVTVAADLSDLP